MAAKYRFDLGIIFRPVNRPALIPGLYLLPQEIRLETFALFFRKGHFDMMLPERHV